MRRMRETRKLALFPTSPPQSSLRWLWRAEVELGDEIGMGTVDFHQVEAGVFDPQGGGGEIIYHADDLLAGQSVDVRALPDGSDGVELDAGARPPSLDGFGQFIEPRDHPVGMNPQHVGRRLVLNASRFPQSAALCRLWPFLHGSRSVAWLLLRSRKQSAWSRAT